MIRNEVQYRVTKAQAKKFEKTLRDLRDHPPDRLATNKELREIYEAGIRSQLEELKEDIAKYEALLKGNRALELSSFDELPTLLVQGRIAAGLSQRELADRLAMKEQQIQRYESTEYASASFTRMRQVALALGLRVKTPAVMEPMRRESREPARATAKKKASRSRSAATKKSRAAAAAKKSSRRTAAKTRRR